VILLINCPFSAFVESTGEVALVVGPTNADLNDHILRSLVEAANPSPIATTAETGSHKKKLYVYEIDPASHDGAVGNPHSDVQPFVLETANAPAVTPAASVLKGSINPAANEQSPT
jgi:hypothetical protein